MIEAVKTGGRSELIVKLDKGTALTFALELCASFHC